MEKETELLNITNQNIHDILALRQKFNVDYKNILDKNYKKKDIQKTKYPGIYILEIPFLNPGPEGIKGLKAVLITSSLYTSAIVKTFVDDKEGNQVWIVTVNTKKMSYMKNNNKSIHILDMNHINMRIWEHNLQPKMVKIVNPEKDMDTKNLKYQLEDDPLTIIYGGRKGQIMQVYTSINGQAYWNNLYIK